MPIVILLTLLISTPGLASCPTAPILEAFFCNTDEQYKDLVLLGEIEILLSTTVTKMQDSAEDTKKKIKPLLTKAKNAVFFNSRAGEALNEFYLYWMTIIDDARPYSGETLDTYQKRVTERAFVLQERANRLRILTE